MLLVGPAAFALQDSYEHLGPIEALPSRGSGRYLHDSSEHPPTHPRARIAVKADWSYDLPLTRQSWVAVKELKLSYHNEYI